MSLASALQPFTWNWVDNNLNDDLVVGGAVYDVTTPSAPVLLTVVPMYYTRNGGYEGSYQGVQGKNYFVQSSVYTDDTWETINPAFPPGGESFQCAPVAGSGGGGSCLVTGYILPSNTLLGIVQGGNTLVGLIKCEGS